MNLLARGGNVAPKACKRMASVGIFKITNVKRISKWHTLFHDTGIIPSPKEREGPATTYFPQAN